MASYIYIYIYKLGYCINKFKGIWKQSLCCIKSFTRQLPSIVDPASTLSNLDISKLYQ